MNELLERISANELDRDGETESNMIIGPEMVGDPKQKSPTDRSTSGSGFPSVTGYLREQLKHKLAACKVMNELLELLDQDGISMARETPILIATKNGITEMVEKILEIFPEAVYDVDSNMKNIVLLSVEHKQPQVYELLLNKKKTNIIHDSVFWEVDNDGNTALHLAAKVANSSPWPIDGPALQMNWEIKWYEHVQNSMPKSYRFLCNKAGETPTEVFTKSHKVLVEEGRKWMIDISSQACPVATGVFVAVAFSSSTKLDVQINETNKRKAELLRYTLFSFANSFSFFLSATAVICFLLIIISSYSERSFHRRNTLSMFLCGLAAFYLSVILTMESFIYGHVSTSDSALIWLFYSVIAISGFFLGVTVLLPSYMRLFWAYREDVLHASLDEST